MNFSNQIRLNNFNLALNPKIIKKNLKKLNRKSSIRKKKYLTEAYNSKSSLKKIRSTERGIKKKMHYQMTQNFKRQFDTIDLTQRSNLNQDSINRISFTDKSLIKEPIQGKRYKRKINKTPVGRYSRKHRDSVRILKHHNCD